MGGSRKMKKSLGLAGFVAGLASLYFVSFNYSLVKGRSMEPAIEDRERVLVNPFVSLVHIMDGDIVTFRSPRGDGLYIKRVIATPGEFAPQDWNGEIYRLKEDEFWVEGDNKAYSVDSRKFGPIRFRDIRGKVLF